LLKFPLCLFLTVDFCLDSKGAVVLFTVLDLLLEFSEEVGEDHAVTARGVDLLLEGVYPGHFLIVLLQNLLDVVLHLLRPLQALLQLHLLHLLLSLLCKLHLAT
jgi:hypothetical protein